MAREDVKLPVRATFIYMLNIALYSQEFFFLLLLYDLLVERTLTASRVILCIFQQRHFRHCLCFQVIYRPLYPLLLPPPHFLQI